MPWFRRREHAKSRLLAGPFIAVGHRMYFCSSLLVSLTLLGLGCQTAQTHVPAGADGGEGNAPGDAGPPETNPADHYNKPDSTGSMCREFLACPFPDLIYGSDGCPIGCDVSGDYDAAQNRHDEAETGDAKDVGAETGDGRDGVATENAAS